MVLGIDISRTNKKERTGVEWYSYFLIQEFKNLMPADTRVVLYVQSEPLADLFPLPPNWEIKILRWPFRFWTIFRLSWEMLLHKPDIFFSPANILPFFTPKKTFTTIHDIGFKRFPECYSSAERWLQDFGVRRAIKESNIPLRPSGFAGPAIFVPSEFTKKELVEIYGADAEKIAVTPLGQKNIFDTIVQNMFFDILHKYDIKKPYFLFIGRKDAKKNIGGIIGAFKIFQEKNPGYSLVLAGPSGYGWDEIAKSPSGLLAMTEGTVVSLNWIDAGEKQMLLKDCEAFLFPSLYEGFGLPILEAFAAGVPVITSNCASMPEVAGPAAILVNPNNPREIAEAMKKITKNPDIKSELVRRGAERLKNFSWKKCADETLTKILK